MTNANQKIAVAYRSLLILAAASATTIAGFTQTNTFPSTGNAGIGTLSPAYPLDVNGQARIAGTFYMNTGTYIGSSTASAPFINLSSANGTTFSMQTGASANASFTIYANGGSNGNNYATIGNSNVGIYFDTRAGFAPYRFVSGGTTDWLDIFSTGNVGIATGNTDPGYKLAVNGSLKATSFNLPTGAGAGLVLTSDASGNATWQSAGTSSSSWSFGGNTVGTLKSLGTVDNNDFPLVTNNVERLRITSGGNVLIGKSTQTNSGYILDINGNVRANQIVVNTSGADFVFDPGYRLPTLREVAAYIKTNHHLPGIAPAAEMQREGLDLEKNQTRLLQKIEELTLYTIQQDKTILSMQDRIARLERLIEASSTPSLTP